MSLRSVKNMSLGKEIIKEEVNKVIHEVKKELTPVEKKELNRNEATNVIIDDIEGLTEEKKVNLNEDLTEIIIADTETKDRDDKIARVKKYLAIMAGLVALGFGSKQIYYFVKKLYLYNNNNIYRAGVNVIGYVGKKISNIRLGDKYSLQKWFGKLHSMVDFLHVKANTGRVNVEGKVRRVAQKIPVVAREALDKQFGVAGGSSSIDKSRKTLSGGSMSIQKSMDKSMRSTIKKSSRKGLTKKEEEELTEEAMRAIIATTETSENPEKSTSTFLQVIKNIISFGTSKAGLLSILGAGIIFRKIYKIRRKNQLLKWLENEDILGAEEAKQFYDENNNLLAIDMLKVKNIPTTRLGRDAMLKADNKYYADKYNGGSTNSSIKSSSNKEDVQEWFNDYKKSILTLYGISSDEFNQSLRDDEI